VIRLQFVAEKGWSSDLIGWFGAGHFSHVDAVLDDGRLLGARSDKVGGQPAGVHIRPPDYLKFSRRVVFTIPATPAQEIDFAAFETAQIGKPYDSMAIFAFVVDRDWRTDDSWICSELVARALEVGKVVPKLFLDASKISPVPLALTVSALAGVTWTDLGAAA
jgi:uncharacterized protein YycO